MRPYLLTPRGRVANLALAMLIVLVVAYLVQRANHYGGAAWIVPAAGVAMLVGVLAHRPIAYGLTAFCGLFLFAAALTHPRASEVLGSLLVVVLALYARSQIYERAAPPEADT